MSAAEERFSWGRKRGWLRVAALLSVVWYVYAAIQIIPGAVVLSRHSLVRSDDVFVLDSRYEAEAFIASATERNERFCRLGSLRSSVTEEDNRQRHWYREQRAAAEAGLTRSQHFDPLRRESGFEPIDRPNDRVEPPPPRSYLVAIDCISRAETVGAAMKIFSTLMAPLLALFAFLVASGLAILGLRLVRWIIAGFSADPEGRAKAVPLPAALQAVDEVRVRKLVRWALGDGALLACAGWITYSLASGTRAGATSAALAQAAGGLVAAAVVSCLYWLFKRKTVE